MTDKQLICLLIDSAKCIAKLLKASNKAAFDYVIESTYSYGCLHGISCETLPFYNFRKAIYDYLAYGETIILSEDIKKCIKMNFTKSSKPTAIDTSFINNVLEAERISRLIEKERQAYFDSLLGRLSEYEQKILLMKGAGMKYEEIASELGVTLQVVKNRIHQAKIKLVNLSKDARKD